MITWALLAAAVVTALLYSRWRHSYWSSRGVPTATGCIPFLGHFSLQFSKSKHRWIATDEIYRKHRGSTVCGFYSVFEPNLFINDVDIAKTLLIKDFDYFTDRRTFELTSPEDKVFNEVLTLTTGNHWKGIRSVLSTSFTSGRMKGVFPLVDAKANALIKYVQKQLEKDSEVKMKKSFGLYTMEVISSCAFGLETDSFENDDSEFLQKARSLFQIGFKGIMKFLFYMMAPKIAQLLKLQLSHENSGYFIRIVREMMKQRREGAKRGDFLDIMMETTEEPNEDTGKRKPKYVLSDDAITASAIMFILAGFDNTANTLAISAFLLAKNPAQQERLREELRGVIAEHGSLNYQGIMEAKYLDACVSETLRLYPPAFFTERQCTKDYKLPGMDLVIPKGFIVTIPIWSFHYDERYWVEPEKFDPDRFLPENKDNVVSGTYLPFGLGPRNCLAMRFALMESKLALAKLVMAFDLQCPPGQETLEMDAVPGVMRPKNDVPLHLTPISEE